MRHTCSAENRAVDIRMTKPSSSDRDRRRAAQAPQLGEVYPSEMGLTRAASIRTGSAGPWWKCC
jgi:hypothetical protein